MAGNSGGSGDDADDAAATGSPPLGLARGTVALLDHCEAWHEAFEREAARLRDRLGERALAVEHVGSTAVRGLAAKPVVDLSVAVASPAVARECVPLLERAGYEHRPDDVEDREFLVRGSEDARTYYLTLTPLDSETWRDHLDFRDHLREHPETRARYERVKRELAARHADDRAAYTAAKRGFVEWVLDDARQ